MRILIVDDSDSFRLYLRSLLEATGLDRVTCAASADEAFDLIAQDRPDLILMDVMMPAMDGFEATRRLKADPATADIPVIMVTISDEEESLAEAFQAGAMDYIRKPIRRPELLARIGSALRLKRESDARQAREEDLRREKEFSAAILENAYDGIAVVSPSGRFIFKSPGMERVFGHPLEAYDTIGEWAGLVFPDPATRAEVLRTWRERALMGHVDSRVAPFMDKNRQNRWCQVHFSHMADGELVLNIQDVTVFEKQRLELLLKHSRHQKDLEAAAEIQQSLLPRRFSLSDSFKFAWEFKPCDSIGGDIFNVFPLGPDHIGLYMLDVSGHGVASSLVAHSVYNFMHYQRSTLVDRSDGIIRVIDPHIVLTRLDEEFPYLKFSKFFTIVYMTLDLRAGTLLVSNAGHPPPVLVCPETGPKPLENRGTIIGLDGFCPFIQDRLTLKPGQKVLLYSDGVTDYKNPAGEFYGQDRFMASIGDLAAAPVQELVAGLDDRLTAFVNQAPPRDDVSLLGFEYIKPKT